LTIEFMSKTMIGIDIGGTNTAIGIVDQGGEILGSTGLATRDYARPEEFVAAIAQACQRLRADLPAGVPVHAIGIGAPNGNFYEGVIEEAPNLRWKGRIPLAAMMSEQFGLPCVLTNDANAAAIGELHYGNAKGMRNFVVVTIGTGLGAGIVINGELLYGHTGFAGELGHTTAVRGGRPCTCGKIGCLETYVSARGLRQTIQDLLERSSAPSVLRRLSRQQFNAKAIFEAAEQGDAIALEGFDITGEILGRQLSDLVALLSPEAIFLFGGVAKAGDHLIHPAARALDQHLLNIFKGTVQLLPSALNHRNAAILGAAALAWKSFQPN
jgi:glucokinase